jgi:hypothetical protein
MTLGNAARDREAEPSSSRVVRRAAKESVKNPIFLAFRKTGARVDNGDGRSIALP